MSYTGILTCANDSLTGILVDGLGLNAAPLGRFNASRLSSYASSLTLLRVANFPFLPSPVDAAIAQLSNLRVLDLSSIVLVGKFPDAVVQLRRLQALDLSENTLDGSLFLLDKLPTTLTSLRLHRNQFVSPVGRHHSLDRSLDNQSLQQSNSLVSPLHSPTFRTRV
jgi:hypothetical protein